MAVPDVRYARAGGVAIAYQVVGDGERTLVFAPHLCDIFSLWRTPYVRRFLDGLAEELRLVVFNARGTGLSDRPRVVTLEARIDDIGIVLDALDLARAALLGVTTGGNACALFAATHPERCERLVLSSAYPRARAGSRRAPGRRRGIAVAAPARREPGGRGRLLALEPPDRHHRCAALDPRSNAHPAQRA